MIIVGAGLAGLLAAHSWPTASVFEAAAAPSAQHRALLRFRSDAVARLTGIEFTPVTVRKGVWWRGSFVTPTIRIANMYARKVTGQLAGERSVWNLEPVQRWIAPEDFYDQLIAAVGARVKWGEPFKFLGKPSEGEVVPVVNTAPLPIVLKELGWPLPQLHRAPIRVDRYRVPGANLFQTVYFPDPNIPAYRASLTGSLLIVESVPHTTPHDPSINLSNCCDAFDLHGLDLRTLDSVDQKFGKIVPLADAPRRALLHKLSTDAGIFSLGRFATWRNVLLDDVVQDIDVLRRLIKASGYERALHFSRERP